MFVKSFPSSWPLIAVKSRQQLGQNGLGRCVVNLTIFHERNLFALVVFSNIIIKVWPFLGGRHSSVDSFMPTILPPWVLVPSTPFLL